MEIINSYVYCHQHDVGELGTNYSIRIEMAMVETYDMTWCLWLTTLPLQQQQKPIVIHHLHPTFAMDQHHHHHHHRHPCSVTFWYKFAKKNHKTSTTSLLWLGTYIYPSIQPTSPTPTTTTTNAMDIDNKTIVIFIRFFFFFGGHCTT